MYMHKPFKFGFIVGRFQHLHIGHTRMIDAGLRSCDKLLLLVGSSQEYGTLRNPFSLFTRMEVIREEYEEEIRDGRLLIAHTDDMTHEDDHSTAWGDFLLNKVEMWRQHYGVKHKLDCMIYGNDEERMSWFDPEKIECLSHIIVARPKDDISATIMRDLLINDELHKWNNFAPSLVKGVGWFNRLKSELLELPEYKEMLNNA